MTLGMELKRWIALVSISMLLLSTSIPSFAFEGGIESNSNSEFSSTFDDIHRNVESLYEEAYYQATHTQWNAITNDFSAYAFILQHTSVFSVNESNQIVIGCQLNLLLAENEIDCLSDFIIRVNRLLNLRAIEIDSSFVISRRENPVDENSSLLRVEVIDLMSEARAHAIELKAVYDNVLFTPYLENAAAVAILVAGDYFAQRVRTGGIWDYKQYYGLTTSYYITGINTYMDGETIGNFHYGYVGSACFAPGVLKTAAGFAQVIGGTSNLSYYNSYFDDPADQADIQWGINVYNQEH